MPTHPTTHSHAKDDDDDSEEGDDDEDEDLIQNESIESCQLELAGVKASFVSLKPEPCHSFAKYFATYLKPKVLLLFSLFSYHIA